MVTVLEQEPQRVVLYKYIYNREKGIVIIGINRRGNKFGGKDSSHFKKKYRKLLYFKVTEIS